MKHKLSTLYRHWRQWTFPAQCRLEVEDGEDWLADYTQAAAAAQAEARNQPKPASPPVATAAEPAINPGFTLSLCNYYFRLRRNAEVMGAEGKSSKELRSINGALEKIDTLLREHGVECLDLTGQPYDIGRADFEQIGEAEKAPGLTRTQIVQCERPAVLINGQMVQRARGLVGKPA